MRRSAANALATALAAALLGSCAATARPGPEAVIPVFAKDDPRVDTAGFVGETLRLSVGRDGVRHTLMAFVVGDTLTLGAMVGGPFDGLVRWHVGNRLLELPFDTGGALAAVPVRVDGSSSEHRGAGASFRGTTWVNVELPHRQWIDDGTPLQLVFLPKVGRPLFLPDDGWHYRVRLQPR